MTTRSVPDATTPTAADSPAAVRHRSGRFAGRAALALAMAVAVAAGSQLLGAATRPASLPAPATDSMIDTTGGMSGLTGDAANGPGPDVLTFQVGNAGGFLNGRKLGDDVINAEFGLLTNGARTAGVGCHPVHVANDVAIQAVTPDDLAA